MKLVFIRREYQNLSNNNKRLNQVNKIQSNQGNIKLHKWRESYKRQFKIKNIGNKNIMMLFNKILIKKLVKKGMFNTLQVIGDKNMIKQNKTNKN